MRNQYKDSSLGYEEWEKRLVTIDLNLKRDNQGDKFKKMYEKFEEGTMIQFLFSKRERTFTLVSRSSGFQSITVKPRRTMKIFPFTKKSSVVVCHFEVTSIGKSHHLRRKKGERSTEFEYFSSSFRFFVHGGIQPLILGLDSPANNFIILKKGNKSVMEDFRNSILFELRNRYPEDKVDVVDIFTKYMGRTEYISSEDLFSFNHIFDLSNRKDNAFYVRATRKSKPRKEKRFFTIKREEERMSQFSAGDLHEYTYYHLKKVKDCANLRFSVNQILPLYFTNPRLFLNHSKRLFLRIQKSFGSSSTREYINRCGLHLVLTELEKRKDDNAEENGRLDFAFFFKFIVRVISTALILEDYTEALKICLRSRIYCYGENVLKLYAKSMFLSSLFMSKRNNKKEYAKIKRSIDKKSEVLMNESASLHGVDAFLDGFRKYPFQLHSLDSYEDLLLATHLSKSIIQGILKKYNIVYNNEHKFERGDGMTKVGRLAFRHDLLFRLDNIAMIVEHAFCKKLEENSFEEGFEIIYYLMFVAFMSSQDGRNLPEFPSWFNTSSSQELALNYGEFRSSELGIPPFFVPHRFFGKKNDPFFLSPIARKRVYGVIFKTFLKHHQKVKEYILKNKERQILSPKEIFFQISQLCYSRGKIDLAKRYIQLARSEDKYQENKLEYCRYQILVSLAMGELGERCRNSSKFPFLLESKMLGFGISKSNVIPHFVDPKEVLRILDGDGDEEEGEEEEEESKVHFYRVPSIFCSGIYTVIGGQLEDESDCKDKKKPSSVLSAFLRQKSRKNKKLRKKKKKKVKFGKEDGEVLDILYTLGIISFLEMDFGRLKKWITMLSDLEFFRDSYISSPKMHNLFQVVANLFHFEWRKFVRGRPNYLLQKEEGWVRKVYVVGDAQVLPWVHRTILIAGLPHRLVPIFVEGLRVVHLSQSQDNPWKECLLKRIKMAARENQGSPLKVIFMIGELDLRCRVTNDVMLESDQLHALFSESYQVELLSDILVRFVENVRKKVLNNMIPSGSSFAICPVFPMLHIQEKTRLLGEESVYGIGRFGCGNRILIFNTSLERLIDEGGKRYEKRGIMFLGGGWERKILDKNNSEKVYESLDLGCASYIVPNSMGKVNLLKELESVLRDYNF